MGSAGQNHAPGESKHNQTCESVMWRSDRARAEALKAAAPLAQSVPPGWYPDRLRAGEVRHWNGSRWSRDSQDRRPRPAPRDPSSRLSETTTGQTQVDGLRAESIQAVLPECASAAAGNLRTRSPRPRSAARNVMMACVASLRGRGAAVTRALTKPIRRSPSLRKIDGT